MKKRIAWMLLAALLLSGCSEQKAPGTQPAEENKQIQATTSTEKVSVRIDVDSLFTNRDRDGSFDESKSAKITLSGTSAACESDAVKIEGSTVTITDEGTYILSGSLENGRIVVNADKEDKTQLVLNGVSVSSADTAPIYILQADKVFITLAEGTENTLQNGGSFAAIDDNNIDGVIFSKEDVTLNGTGSLSISSPAGHGIVSKDELTVAGGSYTVNSANHALAGKDSVCIAGGSMTLAAGKDGIHAENSDDASLGYVYIAEGSFSITAEGDGISAGSAMQIDGGSFTITAGGGSANAQKPSSDGWGNMGGFGGGRPDMGGKPGMGRAVTTAAAQEDTQDSTSLKGVKAGADLVINGGTYVIDAADDGVHSNANLTVTGGSFTIATGDDGFHADETLTVTAGTVTISESYEGLEGLHVKVSGGNITLTASDDGINAAGGNDQSGFGGIRGDQFGGGTPGKPGMGGLGGHSSGNGSIVISGGKVNITASGDGIDANGTFEITGGDTVICGPTQGDTATLDYDVSGVIRGGTFIGTGSAGMAQSFSNADQGVIAVRIGNAVAGTELMLTDSSGNELIRHAPHLDYAVVILSTPELKSGESYTLTIGTWSDTVQAS